MRYRRTSWSVLAFVAAVVARSTANVSIGAYRQNRQLETTGSANYVVEFGGITKVLKHFKPSRGISHTHEVRQALIAHAIMKQKAVLHMLKTDKTAVGTKYESLWISNSLYIENATVELYKKIYSHQNVENVYELQTTPILNNINDRANPIQDTVIQNNKTEIHEDRHKQRSEAEAHFQPYHSPPPPPPPPHHHHPQQQRPLKSILKKRSATTQDKIEFITSVNQRVQETISNIGAPALWAQDINGSGIVVGSIDFGVRVTHEALRGKWRRHHGWYEPRHHALHPYDDDGHGTHTIGSILGHDGIGVAPGASFIACKACYADLHGGAACHTLAVLLCAQFMMCPTNVRSNIYIRYYFHDKRKSWKESLK
jgi:subtilisin family serine protease